MTLIKPMKCWIVWGLIKETSEAYHWSFAYAYDNIKAEKETEARAKAVEWILKQKEENATK